MRLYLLKKRTDLELAFDILFLLRYGKLTYIFHGWEADFLQEFFQLANEGKHNEKMYFLCVVFDIVPDQWLQKAANGLF